MGRIDRSGGDAHDVRSANGSHDPPHSAARARTRRLRLVADKSHVRSVIVDDSHGFAELCARLLVAEGIDVVGAAADRQEGFRLVSDTCPDVAFVDLCLGADNGLELIADIVNSGLAATTFLILFSSCAVEELDELFQHSAADGYLSKARLSGRTVRGVLRGDGSDAVSSMAQPPVTGRV